MFLKKLHRSRKGVSNIISIILITGIMVTSVALTYSYIIPTIETGRIKATLSTSALFLTKMDGAIQTLLYDGVGATRTLEVDAFAGDLEFKTQGLNVRAFIDGALYFPIPGLSFGLAELDIPSEQAIMNRNQIQYIKGGTNSPLAVIDDGSADPAMILLERVESSLYRLELWYRLLFHVRDTGVGGTIDVSFIVIEFQSSESIRGLNSGTYSLLLNKSSVEVNPTRYGFTVAGEPITTSGNDFYITINKDSGPRVIFSSIGARTSVSFNLVVMKIGIDIIELD
ncbi:MAG: hypothetical protein ACFFDW_06405 [Candidatus Thorarchaeota archaeon]